MSEFYAMRTRWYEGAVFLLEAVDAGD